MDELSGSLSKATGLDIEEIKSSLNNICDCCLLPIGDWKVHHARGLMLCGDCFRDLKSFFRSASV